MDFNRPNCSTFCIAPWYEIRIDSSGTVRCCQAIEHVDDGVVDLVKWYNKSDTVTSIRNKMLNGEKLDACAICYESQKTKMNSIRIRRNFQAGIHQKFFNESLKQSVAVHRIDSTDTIKPAFIHVSFNNICNLSCRFCQPYNSTKLTHNLKKLNIISNDVPTLLGWTADQTKWDSFLELIRNNTSLLSLHIMGGEPLYSDKFEELLDWCIETGNTNFYLTFVSNATIYKESIFEKLSKFKGAQIELSVENLHDTNDFLRLGGNTALIKNNIEKYIKNKPDNTSIVLRTVPQALSVEHYDTLIDFAIKHNVVIDHNFLHEPKYLQINVLPTEYKKVVADKLKLKYKDLLSQAVAGYGDVNNRNASNLHNLIALHIEYIIGLLEQDETDDIDNIRHEFVKKINAMAPLSEKKFLDLYPLLKDMYYEYN